MNRIIDWPGLGTVVLTVNRRARRFVARWRDGAVHLTVPPGATAADVTRALAELAPRLAAKRPQAQYAEGTVVNQPDFRVRLRVTRDARGGVGVRGTTADAEVIVNPELPLDDPEVKRAVSTLLMRVAHARARTVLPALGALVAVEVGARPSRWIIGRGLRTLGTCSVRGEITLSAALMFLPDELRRYIICHELAHLTEHNHSARFHALCNNYCDGREAELQHLLRTFRWPPVR